MAIADIAEVSVQRADPKGLRIARRFTRDGVHPYDEIEWERRDSVIPGESGNVFEQKGVEVPKFWSQTATNVVASKYFRGKLGAPERESSVKQMVDRVVDTIARAGFEGGYFASAADRDAFADELKYLMVNQYASFNSPVWFNIGVDGVPQQASACFIHARRRLGRRFDQVRRHHPSRGQDGDPRRGPPRRARIHLVQGQGREEGLGARRGRI